MFSRFFRSLNSSSASLSRNTEFAPCARCSPKQPRETVATVSALPGPTILDPCPNVFLLQTLAHCFSFCCPVALPRASPHCPRSQRASGLVHQGLRRWAPPLCTADSSTITAGARVRLAASVFHHRGLSENRKRRRNSETGSVNRPKVFGSDRAAVSHVD